MIKQDRYTRVRVIAVTGMYLVNVCLSPSSPERTHLQDTVSFTVGFPGDTVVKNLPANAGVTRDVCSIPGSGRSPRVGNGNPLQYLAWKIPWTEEPEVTKSQTWLSD